MYFTLGGLSDGTCVEEDDIGLLGGGALLGKEVEG